jgi:hypothetical protein
MVPLIIIVQIGRASDMGTDKPVIIVVDQYVHNAAVYYGDEVVYFSLPRVYGTDLARIIESRFLSFSGLSLDMDDIPYKAVGDLRYYRTSRKGE